MNSVHPATISFSADEMEAHIQENKKRGINFVTLLIAIPCVVIALALMTTPSFMESSGPIGTMLIITLFIPAIFVFLPSRPRP